MRCPWSGPHLAFYRNRLDADEAPQFMQTAREDYLTNGVNPTGQHPAGHEHPEVPQTRGIEAIDKNAFCQSQKAVADSACASAFLLSLLPNRLW